MMSGGRVILVCLVAGLIIETCSACDCSWTNRNLVPCCNELPSDVTPVLTSAPSLPYSQPLTKSMVCGRIITIYGRFTGITGKSYFALAAGSESGADMPLYIEARFNYRMVVLNDYKDGSWWTNNSGEIRVQGSAFPFDANGPFVMTIRGDEQTYRVAVNGKEIAVYYHRQALSAATHLTIGGPNMEIVMISEE